MKATISAAWSVALVCGIAGAESTTRVSVATGGAQANGDSGYLHSISADGRYVAFTSLAPNLVPGDTNGTWDVFVHDRLLATTERVSVAAGGAQANAQSINACISADGRCVAFSSYATNLVAGDTNSFIDFFVHDRQLGTTERVNVSTGGAQADDYSFDLVSISADGRYVAFASPATNLVAGDTSGMDIYVRDRHLATTERVSVAIGGAEPLGYSITPSISGDGRHVAFMSDGPDLVAGDTNGTPDIFVRDRQAGTTERVSVATGGVQASDVSLSPSISADGRCVVFRSYAWNLVAGDFNGMWDVFVHDRQTTSTERVSVTTTGAETSFGNPGSPSISADGRYVAFQHDYNSLVPGDTNGWADVFLRDRQLATIERVSLAADGAEANGASDTPRISADGRYVSFGSFAPDLVAGDTNALTDIFVRDRAPVPGLAFCSGDGTGTACPCGNAGPAGAGCLNSLGSAGMLAASGIPSLSMDSLVLGGAGMPNAAALYFQGTSSVNGGLGAVFGDGLRCVAGSVVRLGVKTNVAGASQYPGGTDPPVSVRGAIGAPGVRRYQVWYRNAAAFCQGGTFNLTNGWEIAWGP